MTLKHELQTQIPTTFVFEGKAGEYVTREAYEDLRKIAIQLAEGCEYMQMQDQRKGRPTETEWKALVYLSGVQYELAHEEFQKSHKEQTP